MRHLLVLIISLAFFKANAQRNNEKDSLQVLSQINDWNQAWQIKDYKLAAKWYSIDARFTNAFGDKRRGQNQIEDFLKDVFALPFVMSGHSETIQHTYQSLSGDIIVVHTAVVRKGQQMPDGSVMPDRQTTHMRVFQRDKNGWLIEAHLISDARDKQIPKH